eukprot:4090182-Alexandrium_andersonii.AAC.1
MRQVSKHHTQQGALAIGREVNAPPARADRGGKPEAAPGRPCVEGGGCHAWAWRDCLGLGLGLG